METTPNIRDNIFTTLSIVNNLEYVESFDLFLQKILPEAVMNTLQRDMYPKNFILISKAVLQGFGGRFGQALRLWQTQDFPGTSDEIPLWGKFGLGV